MNKHDKSAQAAMNVEFTDERRPYRDIHLKVATPNGVYRGCFPKITKIKDVIAAIVEDRNLEDGDAFQLFFGETILEPVQRPLVSFCLPSKALLTLVATGSGV